MRIGYCRFGMVVAVAMLAGCGGCGGDGEITLSLGDGGFGVFGDGGFDGLDDRWPDGGTAGVPVTGTAGVGIGASGGTSGGIAGAGFAGAGFPGGSGGAPPGGSGGSWGGSGGTGSGGFPWTGGSGGTNNGTRCDIYSTCWYPDGTICDQYGFCCTLDGTGRCCNGMLCKPEPTWNTPPVPATVDEPWVPPLPPEDVGAPGWRESDEILCTHRAGNTYAHSVWSDSRGVYVAAVSDGYNSADTTCPWCIKESIYFNDGTGWTQLPGTSSGGPEDLQVGGGMLLTGFDNGPLVLYGYGTYDPLTGQPCGLALFDEGERECQPADGITDVHVVNSTLAYAVLNGSLIQYDGERWGPVPAAAPSQPSLYMVWANESVVMATGMMPGTIYTLRNGTWYVENTRTLEYFSAIWGFSATDVWAGTQQGSLFHYDGTAWNEVEWSGGGCRFDSMILSMWGSGGTLYFVTMTSIGRWNGTQAETIAQWECDGNGQDAHVTGVWGNSPTEVFFSIVDNRQPVNQCGSNYVLYYDGSKFHPM